MCVIHSISLGMIHPGIPGKETLLANLQKPLSHNYRIGSNRKPQSLGHLLTSGFQPSANLNGLGKHPRSDTFRDRTKKSDLRYLRPLIILSRSLIDL